MMIPHYEKPAYLLYDDDEKIMHADWIFAEEQADHLVHQELKNQTSLPDLWDFYVGLLKVGNAAQVYNYLSLSLEVHRSILFNSRQRIEKLQTAVEPSETEELIARLEKRIASTSESINMYGRSLSVLRNVLDLYCVQGKELKWHQLSKDIQKAIVNADPPWRCEKDKKLQLWIALEDVGVAHFEVGERLRWMAEQTKLIYLIQCLMDSENGIIDFLGSEGAAWGFVERTFVGEGLKESSFKRQWKQFTLPTQESRLSGYRELQDIVRRVCGNDSEESSTLSE